MFQNSRLDHLAMAQKHINNQQVTRRRPQQERALEKVGLMLEAATRILDKHGLAGLTTNRVAEVAGVSIGTLYQYFDDKTALLDALAERELQALSDSVMGALTGPAPIEAGGRMRAVVRAVLDAYGGRTGVHRLLVQHLITRGTGTPLPGLREAIIHMMSSGGIVAHDQRAHPLSPEQAFVMTHAVSGVIRALLAAPEKLAGPQRRGIEDTLVRLVATVMSGDATAPAAAKLG